MPTAKRDSTVRVLQALLDRSARTATLSVAESIAFPDRQMTAAELVAFWRDARMMAMATVGPKGQPHLAPVHLEIDGTTLRLVIYDDTVRRLDLRTNPRVAFTTGRTARRPSCTAARARWRGASATRAPAGAAIHARS
jgi:hypothetical protein